MIVSAGFRAPCLALLRFSNIKGAAFRVIMINDRVSGEGETGVGASSPVNNSRPEIALIPRNSRQRFPFDYLSTVRMFILPSFSAKNKKKGGRRLSRAALVEKISSLHWLISHGVSFFRLYLFITSRSSAFHTICRLHFLFRTFSTPT